MQHARIHEACSCVCVLNGGTTMARLITGGTAMRPGSAVMFARMEVKQPRTGMIMTTARQKAQILYAAATQGHEIRTRRTTAAQAHLHLPPHGEVVESYVLKMVMTAQMK